VSHRVATRTLHLAASVTLAGCLGPSSVEGRARSGEAVAPSIPNSKDYVLGPAERPNPAHVATFDGQPIEIKRVLAYGDESSSIELVFSTIDRPCTGMSQRERSALGERTFEVRVAPVLLPDGTREWRINHKFFLNNNESRRLKGVTITRADVDAEVWGSLEFNMVSAGRPRQRITYSGSFIATGCGGGRWTPVTSLGRKDHDEPPARRQIPLDLVVAGTRFDLHGAVLRPHPTREGALELALSSRGDECERTASRADLDLWITLAGPDLRPIELRLSGEVAPDDFEHKQYGLSGVQVDILGPIEGPGDVEVRMSGRRKLSFGDAAYTPTKFSTFMLEVDGTFLARRCPKT
jgi:hypothetical protein